MDLLGCGAHEALPLPIWHPLATPAVEVWSTSHGQETMNRELDSDQQQAPVPPHSERWRLERKDARRGGHQDIEHYAAGKPHEESKSCLREATLRKARLETVQECQLDVVPAEREPQGEGRNGKEQPEPVSLQREHHADTGREGHVSRDRAPQRLS